MWRLKGEGEKSPLICRMAMLPVYPKARINKPTSPLTFEELSEVALDSKNRTNLDEYIDPTYMSN